MNELLTEEQRSVAETARRFGEREVLPLAATIDREDAFPRGLYRRMAELGLFAVSLPEAAGGAGMDTTSVCLAMEELARCSGAIGNAFAIPVEAALFLHHHGNAAQRALIPSIVDGSLVFATAMTEPDYGSDAASIRTAARRVEDGWIVNGTKAWVTLGGVADRIMVFARTGDAAGHKAISCFLVDARAPGVSRGRNEDLLGMHGLEDCQIVLDNVHVPSDALIGEENRAFGMAMDNFNFSRLLMSSMALGMARAAMEDALAYARNRKQFGQPILGFQAVQFMLADMATEIDAARLLIHHAARRLDAGLSIVRAAAQAKLFTTDMAVRNVSNALQIHGGNGYSREYRIERLYRDVRLAQIYEGTNQIQRLIIARQLDKDYA
ncbi:acyl-CoA dehydrogenase [Verticiella sediminum]|uniref:Acyl-CoA dehydrogenase n=1 Tax=Verticiella sediminum TaxID=1247510 RepID=A0A556A7E0_9BURK|nr:acyl-CoA dehydrogenase family protein [Verticiella sediminum]TSH88794.1 acyl-CoA dehydrogenase [Verticiella sediminum]